MKKLYFSLALLCSGLACTPLLHSTAVTCPCVSKDGGECCCAGRGVPCNCVATFAKEGSVAPSCPCPKTTVPPQPTTPLVEVSYGELFDKVTILEIKEQKIEDAAKREHVTTELAQLRSVINALLTNNSTVAAELTALKQDLAAVNWKLWQVEDALRVKEAAHSFDEEFIALARSVYRFNTERCSLKSKISAVLNSHIVEEKCYAAS